MRTPPSNDFTVPAVSGAPPGVGASALLPPGRVAGIGEGAAGCAAPPVPALAAGSGVPNLSTWWWWCLRLLA